MATDLLEIIPRELKFTFEIRKQSSCSVRLVNNSQHHVAFKVKTTSPKKYCVRPNVGIITPKSVRDFTVTMQASRVAPADLICKDKFLIQSTIIPAGTGDEDITPSMFDKDSGKYIEQSKLKVVIIIPAHSPDLSPTNGTLKQLPAYEASERKNQVTKNLVESKLVHDKELKPARDIEELKLVEDIQIMKSKIVDFESKLCEAEATISKLTQERKSNVIQRELLQQELEALRHKKDIRRVQVGFPFLFVCMVALISVMLGYLLKA